MKKILIFCVTFIICILCAVFVAWDFNPAAWGSDGRFFALIVAIWVSAGAAIFSEILK